MAPHASGPFDVTLTPHAGDTPPEGAALGRLSIDKKFHGDLVGSSVGEMISAMTAVKGSASYCALERVNGSLHGRTGTFALQHTGIMNRGVPQLTITVVPDSGTGELAGLTGRMDIQVDAGQHAYTFDYSFESAP